MKLILALAFLALMAHAAFAQDDRLRQACQPDVLTFCAHLIPLGRPAIEVCMRANQAKLSAQCLAAIKAQPK